jgi:hypothetical protein
VLHNNTKQLRETERERERGRERGGEREGEREEREGEREICATAEEWGKPSRKPSGLIPNRRKQSRNAEKRR